MSSVLELKENIVDEVLELGAKIGFLENPAFSVALAEVNSYIKEVGMEDPSVVLVDSSNETLSFTYTAGDGDKYKFDLSCPDENTVRFIRIDEPHTYVGMSGSVVRKKSALELIAKLEEHGDVYIITNKGAIDNVGCDNHHYNMTNYVEKRIYTKRGVMYEREMKTYPVRKGEGYFHRVGVKEMLLLARQAFDYGPWADKFEKRTLLRREMIDTAKLVYEDRKSEANYIGIVPLKSEDSLRDLVIADEYNTYPMKDVVIPALTEAEVADLLAREKDEKVAEGLGYFAQGRTSYCYNSVENK